MPTPPRPVTLSETALAALLGERETFRRFLVRRVGSAAVAEDLLQESLVRALQRGESLRRGESAIAWFYRILRRAVADHFRRSAASRRQLAGLERELSTTAETATPPADWDAVLCRCFEALLPALPPRYAELIRRIDLGSEPRALVARQLRLSPGALDVSLHRARAALRRRLEIFCGACSRESCLACGCKIARTTN